MPMHLHTSRHRSLPERSLANVYSLGTLKRGERGESRRRSAGSGTRMRIWSSPSGHSDVLDHMHPEAYVYPQTLTGTLSLP